VGTSSMRRRAQVLAAYPHLQVVPLRGSVHSRMTALNEGKVEATILAAAGGCQGAAPSSHADHVRACMTRMVTGCVDSPCIPKNTCRASFVRYTRSSSAV
jgi:hypothetical protein